MVRRNSPVWLALAMLGMAARPAEAGVYTLVTLNRPAGSTSVATAINANGQVAGYDFATASGTAEGFVWTSGQVVTGVYDGQDTRFQAINAHGIVAGQAVAANGNAVPLTFDKNGAAFTPIAMSNTLNAYVAGINVHGVVVGYVTETFGVARGLVSHGHSASFLKAPGAKLSTLGNAINDAGTIIGSDQASYAATKGFIYAGGKFTTLTVPGAPVTEPLFIDAAGDIAGWYSDVRGNIHGFTDIGGVIKTIDNPAGGTTIILSIGTAGQVFGTYADAAGLTHSFVFYQGVFDPIEVPGAQQTTITAANAGGSFVGIWLDADYVNHAFVGVCAPKQSPCTRLKP